MDITQIINDTRNDMYGIYTDNDTNEYIFCLIDNNDKKNIIMINLIAKYIIKINTVTKTHENMNYFTYSSFTTKEPDNAVPSKIDYYINNSVIEGKIKKCAITKDIDGLYIIKFKIYNFNKTLKKKYINNDIMSLINNNTTINITHGGTRAVILLDKVVLKETDPTCSIYCEQISNYYTRTFDINIADLIGIIFYNNKPMIVEMKYTPVAWESCLYNIDEYKKYKQKFEELVNNINEYTVLGDYNLSNILLDKTTDKLIITDFNGTTPSAFLARKLISSIANANNFIIRLRDYLTDSRILNKIGIQTFSNISLFKNILNNIFNNYEKCIKFTNDKSVSMKYYKYKQKYLSLKNKSK